MSDDMKEIRETKPSFLMDREAWERYQYVIEVGKRIFQNSALVDQTKKIAQEDVDRIAEFHRVVSPANPDSPWRLTSQEEKSIEKGDLVDPSFFGNWEAPG